MSRINPKVRRDIQTRIQMSRCSGDKDYFRLTIEDVSSSTVICEIELDPLAVADLVSNRTTQPMETEYYHNENIGKIHECKRFNVPLEKLAGVFESYDDKDRQRDLKHVYDLAEELNPGWKVDRSEFNSKLKGRGAYEVILRRYLDKE